MNHPMKGQKIDKEVARYFVEIPDLGHSNICPICFVRSGNRKELVSKPRDIEMIVCDGCKSEKHETDSWKYRAKMTYGG